MTDPGDPDLRLPEEPIHRLLGPLERFMHVEAAGGVVLLVATIAALFLANSPWSDSFLGFWQTRVVVEFGDFRMDHSLKHWVSDGLMAVFFFVMGLEIKRELVTGELRELRNAVLPIAAAIGGMVVPALIFLALQDGGPTQRGWGIPMATDIAFVVGCLAVLGSRVPTGLRVLVVSLAIADDLGAILVIAIGYTDHIDLTALVLGIAGIAAVALLARLGVRSMLLYTLVGIFVWLAFHESGVHATIAGVVLGLQTPASSYLHKGRLGGLLDRAGALFEGGGWRLAVSNRPAKVRVLRRVVRESISPLEYLEDLLHPWVGFAIVPVFALANAGVPLRLEDFGASVSIAIVAALAIGKPLGIVLFCLLAVRLGLGRLPSGVTWGQVAGGGCLAGIGFTMSLFISGLAFKGEEMAEIQDASKVGILAGSILAAVVGMVVLSKTLPPKMEPGS